MQQSHGVAAGSRKLCQQKLCRPEGGCQPDAACTGRHTPNHYFRRRANRQGETESSNEIPTQRIRTMQHARTRQPAAKKETPAKPARSASDSGLRHDLTELSADIRAYRQRIHAVVNCSLPSCADGESPGLAALLDRWIMQATGRNQLILLACATELGVIKWRHLEAGGHTLSRLDCRALRALYWATVRRWQGSKAQGQGRSSSGCE